MSDRLPFHEQLKYERERRGWSQEDIADKVGCDTKTVGRWENGLSLPRSFLRQKLVELFGKDAEEFGLLAPDKPGETTPEPAQRFAWGDAPSVTSLCGREREQAEVRAWLEDERCRVIALLGIGGIGKTVLAAAVARQASRSFAVIFWRSLHNALPFKQFLKDCLQAFLPSSIDLSGDEDALLSLLMQQLQGTRCLIVLDNVETILQEGRFTGAYRTGYEGYSQFIQRFAETSHASALLLTSREKPAEVARLEGKNALVRSLTVVGVAETAGRHILQDSALSGDDQHWSELIRLYSGNPLALKIVAEPIRALFGGEIARFLQVQESAFGDVVALLEQQFARLSAQEQEILYWLAIEREATSLDQLRENLISAPVKGALLGNLDSLQRRSLIETRGAALFTLQPVILEYATNRLVQQACGSFGTDQADTWTNFALIKAQTKDYIRVVQERLILAPIAEQLLNQYGKSGVEQALRGLLAAQRQKYDQWHGSDYAAGNALNLMLYLQWDMRGFDSSHLTIRQAYLQNALLPDVNFTEAHFIDTLFTNTFGNICSVAFDRGGDYLAAGSSAGDIWVYHVQSGRLLFTCRAHTDAAWCIIFSPDGALLVSSSDDNTIRFWDSKSGQCLAVLNGHTDRVRAVALSMDGATLASGSDDQTVRLWDVQSGQCLKILSGHTGRIWALGFSPDGALLASGGTDQTIRLWDTEQNHYVAQLAGHSDWIRSLAFNPDGTLLATGSDDGTIRLWDTTTRSHLNTLHGHTNRVWSVAFNANGSMLASGSEDQSVRLWDAKTGQCLAILQGHTNGVRSVTFNPVSGELASGGDDQTVRLWDTRAGYCLKALQGYANRILSVCFSPDGKQLISCSEDRLIRLWDVESEQITHILRDRTHGVKIAAFSPGGLLLASAGEDQTLRLWNSRDGRCLCTLRGHSNWIRALAFSFDGQLLASGSEDQMVRLWSVDDRRCLNVLEGHTSWVRGVAFNQDGTLLASASDDATIRLWEMATGRCRLILQGHTGRVRSVVFSPDGGQGQAAAPTLASASEDGTIRLWNSETGQVTNVLQGHEGRVRAVSFSAIGQLLASGGDDAVIRLWDSRIGQCIGTLHGHENRVRWVAFAPRGYLLVSGSDDGTIKLWDAQTATCLRTLVSERPYERMNIAGVEGLTEAQKTMLHSLGAIEQ